MPTTARRSSSRVVARSASPETSSSRAGASSAASRSPRSRAAKASAPMPALASSTRAAMPAAAKSPSWPSTAASASSSAPRSSRAGRGRRRCRRGAAPVRRPRAARARRRPPAARRRARGRSESKNCFDFGRRHRADELVDDLAVAEGLDGRDALDAEAGRERLVGVDVDLGQHAPGRRGSPPPLPAPGSACRQGPHHSAQKSTTTGVCRESSITSRSKVASVTSTAIGAGYAGPNAGSRLRWLSLLAYCADRASVVYEAGSATEEERCRTSIPPGPAYEAFGRGDLEALKEMLAEDGTGSPPTSCRSAAKPRAATRSSGTSPRSPTTGRRSASSRRSSSTPASGWSCGERSEPATTATASRRPSPT